MASFIANGGDVSANSIKGNGVALARGRAAISMTADADKTPVAAEFQCHILEVTSTLSLTATRNIILPLTDSAEFIVANLTSGAQSLIFKGASGAGVTVANGKRCLIYSDGTNYVRVTPDNP